MSTENDLQEREHEESHQIVSDGLPKSRITDDIRNLLNSLLKKTLDKRIIRLENRKEDQSKNAKLIAKNFENFTNQLDSIIKNMEETLKKRETKKKEETPKKLKVTKHSLASKSVPPGKKLKINTKPEYNTNTNRNKEKKNININTNSFKTEENLDKSSSHNRAKSFKEKRIFSEANIKKPKIKLVKKVDNAFSPYRKDDKKEDNKAKTMTHFNSEKKSESKRHNITVNKDKMKEKDLKIKKKDDLAKTFSEGDMKEKIKRAKEKSLKNEKKEKNNLQTKSESSTNRNKSEKKEKKIEKDNKKKEIPKKEKEQPKSKKEEKKEIKKKKIKKRNKKLISMKNPKMNIKKI